jgi:hypothetical protein
MTEGMGECDAWSEKPDRSWLRRENVVQIDEYAQGDMRTPAQGQCDAGWFYSVKQGACWLTGKLLPTKHLPVRADPENCKPRVR